MKTLDNSQIVAQTNLLAALNAINEFEIKDIKDDVTEASLHNDLVFALSEFMYSYSISMHELREIR